MWWQYRARHGLNPAKCSESAARQGTDKGAAALIRATRRTAVLPNNARAEHRHQSVRYQNLQTATQDFAKGSTAFSRLANPLRGQSAATPPRSVPIDLHGESPGHRCPGRRFPLAAAVRL